MKLQQDVIATKQCPISFVNGVISERAPEMQRYTYEFDIQQGDTVIRRYIDTRNRQGIAGLINDYRGLFKPKGA